MQQTIENILQGNYKNDEGNVRFLPYRIEHEIQPGQDISGQFQIEADTNSFFRGKIYSSNYRMKIDKEYFEGCEQVIKYKFSSNGMEIGETIKGEFTIVTNLGQYFIPFTISITASYVNSSMGYIKNLFHFTNLAKANFSEAVEIFYNKKFEDILIGNERQYLCAYRGLLAQNNPYQKLEEFLVLIHKKHAIEYVITEETKEYGVILEDTGDSFKIERNGWGYTKLEISVECDFINLTKTEILEQDFLGNQCTIDFEIKKEKLHIGRNTGKIIISSVLKTLECNVIVNNDNKIQKFHPYEQEKKLLTVQMMDAYLKFRTKRITMKEWIDESDQVVSKMVLLHPNSILFRLYQAQILLYKDSFNEAGWILNRVESMFLKRQEEGKVRNEEEYAYFLYLTTLYDKSDERIFEVVNVIREMLTKRPNSFKMLWMLFYLDESYKGNYVRKYQELKEQFLQNVNSPIVYMEAFNLLKKDIYVLTSLTEFEVKVIEFSLKYKVLTAEIAIRFQEQLNKIREDKQKYISLLEKIFDEFSLDETLTMICSILIQNNITESSYHVYFKEALKRSLKITNLYEYFMFTIQKDTEEMLPKSVFLYFTYNNELDNINKTYLYHNVFVYREQIPQIYETYHHRIIEFLQDQMTKADAIKRQPNLLLGELINSYSQELKIEKNMVASFVPLLFFEYIKTNNQKMRYAVVIHEQLEKEYKYSLAEGGAMIDIFSKDCSILLEDEVGNRFTDEDGYKLRSFIKKEFFLDKIKSFSIEHLGYSLYLCDGIKTYTQIDFQNARYFQHALFSKDTVIEFKRKIGERLLTFYFDNDMLEELDVCLEQINLAWMKSQDVGTVIKYMFIRDKLETAYEHTIKYGFERIPIKTLVRICDYRVRTMESTYCRDLLWLCFYVLEQGKYTPNILDYLVDFFEGTVKQLKLVLNSAKAMDIDGGNIAKEIIMQEIFAQMYVSQIDEVFLYYEKQKGIYDRIYKAYIIKQAYRFYAKNEVVSMQLFHSLYKMYEKDEELNIMMQLSLLKHIATKERINRIFSELDVRIILSYVQNLIERHIYSSFMLAFADLVPTVSICLERSFVEFIAYSHKEIMLHYHISKDNEYLTEYETVKMREVVEGHYIKSFSLLFGERLQYYISEIDESDQVLESGIIEKSDISDHLSDSRYYMLNDVIMCNDLEDQQAALSMLERYEKKDYIIHLLMQLE